MTNDATRASATALPDISRRNALTITGTGLAAALAGFAAHAAKAAQPEHPWEKANRLADELSQALAEGDSQGGPAGRWLAEVYPSTHHTYSIAFGNIASREWPRHNVSLPCQNAIDAHRKAREAFGKACDDTDKVLLGREASKAALRRYARADRAEDKALEAVCAIKPHGKADAKAKADYLLPFIPELQQRHVLALLGSAVLS